MRVPLDSNSEENAPGAATHTIVIADAHLDGDKAESAIFRSFLRTIEALPGIHTCYILGDLFNIWLGSSKLRLSYQQPVLDEMKRFKTRNIKLKYVEGNRDYFLAPYYLGQPFDEIVSEATHAIIGQKHFYLTHGDLVNAEDKQYRLWRRISRNRGLYAGFNCLPRIIAVRLADYLERRFRSTNRKYKAIFPADACNAFITPLFQAGFDAVILGHFHEKRQQEYLIQEKPKHLYVVPAWKDNYEYLRISSLGEVTFEQFSSNP